MIVVEAAARGVPSVVVREPDNAAIELIEEGVNGTVARSASPADLAEAIIRVHQAGPQMRESTAAWYRRNATRLSLSSSLDEVVASYSGQPAVAPSVALPRGGVAFCGLGSGRRSRADSERPSSGPPQIWAVVTGAMKLARTSVTVRAWASRHGSRALSQRGRSGQA